MSGVEVAAVVVPVAVAAASGGLSILKGPRAMLKNTRNNVNESRFLLGRHGDSMAFRVLEELNEACNDLEERLVEAKAAGDHRVKNAYKPKVWSSTRNLEHRSEKLYDSTKASSARSVAEERVKSRKDAARKASEETVNAAKEDPKAVKPLNSDGPGTVMTPPLPKKKSINGLNKKASQSSIRGRTERSGSSRTEVIPPLPTSNNLNELGGGSSKPAIRELPSKSQASERDNQQVKNPVRRGTVA